MFEKDLATGKLIDVSFNISAHYQGMVYESEKYENNGTTRLTRNWAICKNLQRIGESGT